MAEATRLSVAAVNPWMLAIEDNPLARDQQATSPVCAWHAAVFEYLFRDLLGPHWRVQEVACCAKGDKACLFVAGVDTAGVSDFQTLEHFEHS